MKKQYKVMLAFFLASVLANFMAVAVAGIAVQLGQFFLSWYSETFTFFCFLISIVIFNAVLIYFEFRDMETPEAKPDPSISSVSTGEGRMP